MVMIDLWLEVIQNPYLLALLIIISTYLLEDAAIVSAALLSTDGMISPFLAFYALFIGIFSGDLGLYAIGFLMKKSTTFKNWIGQNKIDVARNWLNRRMILTVFLVRPVPGLRFPVYTACGFVGLPFNRFFYMVLIASIAWTGTIFSGVFFLGKSFWPNLSSWKWLLLLIFIGLLIYGGRVINSRLSRKITNEKI